MTNLIKRTGLYRVWVPLHDDGQAPLISIWIDPMMTAFEPRTRPLARLQKVAHEILRNK